MRPLLAALFVSSLAASSANAATIRWPWEKPSEGEARRDGGRRERDRDRRVDPRPDGRVPLGPHPPSGRAPSNEHDVFVMRMLGNTADQIAISEAALDRSNDPAVRALARRTLQEARAFERTLLVRADELDLDARGHASSLSRPDGDLDFLATELDVVFRDRAYFAGYKSSVGGAFHGALQRHWDEMVERREDTKRLHDEVRNASRRG